MINALLSLGSGLLLALAFPKVDFYWLAWIALVPFFWALNHSEDLKQTLLCGFLFGVSFFGIHLFWVTTLFRFVGWWVVLGWVGLVLFQTLFILLFSLLSHAFASGLPRRKMVRSPEKPASSALVGRGGDGLSGIDDIRNILYAIGLAALWTFIEWLRAFGPFGVTGGDLGYSQVQILPLIQIASLTSVYGVSFLIVFFNIALTVFLMNTRKWQPLAVSIILILIALGYGWQVMNAPPRSSSLSDVLRQNAPSKRLALIQPNIDQKTKMDPNNIGLILDIHEKMSRRAMEQKPEIIVWPETALFTYLLHDPAAFERVKKIAVDSGAWLIVGTPHYEGGKAYNSIISISPSGVVVSRYDKQQLVPFGEYLPFRAVLFPLLKRVGYYDSEFTSDPYAEPISAGGLKIAAAICFESTFPQLIRKRVKPDSAFILLVTNDAWFGNSAALYFHLNTGIFRAIENRRYFFQVGNTGVTAVIDPFGRVLKKTAANRDEILIFEIPLS